MRFLFPLVSGCRNRAAGGGDVHTNPTACSQARILSVNLGWNESTPVLAGRRRNQPFEPRDSGRRVSSSEVDVHVRRIRIQLAKTRNQCGSQLQAYYDWYDVF